MKKRVYTVLVEHLKRWGVTHAFGIPGKSISPLMLELDKQEIRYVLSRHECGAGYEAAGYALAKNTIGVAIGTSGPGGTNMLTAAAQAKECQLPVFFLTGHPSIQDTGKGLGQDSSHFGSDLAKMFEPVTLFSARVERGDLLQMYLRHAIEKALIGPKGPVHLCIPFDVLMEEIEPFQIQLPMVEPLVSNGYKQAIAMLENAQNPVLVLGKGVFAANAFDEVQTFSEHWQIPVITTPGGKGTFSNQHPLYLGGFGLGGISLTEEFLKNDVDLMIVIGSKLCDMSMSGLTQEMYPKQVLHFDYDHTFTGKSIPVLTYTVAGDVKWNLQRLLEMAQATRRDYPLIHTPASQPIPESQSTLISASKAVQVLCQNLPQDALVFGDAGSHSFYAIRDYVVKQPGTFYFDEVFLAMGYGIGFSIGAKIGNPDRPIICLTGDGCFMLQGTEISTAVNEQAPVIFIVMNNGRLDMVDKGMSHNTGCSVGAVFETKVNVSMFAQSLGAQAYCCHTEEDIAEAVKTSLQSSSTSVIEIIVDPEEVPPILSRLLALN